MRALALVPALFALLAGGCGGGEPPLPPPRIVNINAASSCSNSMGGLDLSFVKIPANCQVEGIEGKSFETDQSVIHLSGSSFGPESNNCSNPPLTLGGPPCIPIFPGNSVEWQNLSNGVAGFGSGGYHVLGFVDPDWFIIFVGAQGYAGWSTQNESYPAGIPLTMGANSIRVTVEDANHRGTGDITVIRITDVTPPSVYSVDPEPNGTYYFRVVVYLTEQLDPERLTNALQVVDSNGQPTTGTTVYDPLKLTLVWRPEAALIRGAAYSARLSDIADLAGNTMIDAYEWPFTVY